MLPHGVWPSGDGSRIYVGLENADGMAAIDTATNKLIATSPIGQAPQAITYVPNAVPEGDGTQGLQPLDVAGRATHLVLGAVEGRKTVGSAGNVGSEDKAPTSVSLFDQGLIQVLQASVTGLEPKRPLFSALHTSETARGRRSRWPPS
jgi:YVTN family beta-propeller protein